MIPEGYRLLTAEDVGKVFGVDLETTAYAYFAGDYANFEVLGTSQINLTDFITYEYDSNMGGAYISFDSGIVSGADNLWLNTPPSFETCTIAEGTELTTFYANTDWNTWFYVKDKADPKAQFITDMDALAESIVGKAGSSGKKTIKEMKSLVDGLKTEFVTQEKTATPSKETQSVVPDDNYDGLSKVTVNPIPTDYIIPSGTLEVIENGEVDCSSYEKVNVNVPSEEPTYWDGSYTESDSKGYTLTLNVDSSALNNSGFTYSIDGGSTYNEFTATNIILEEVTSIIFKESNAGLYRLWIGTSSGYNDIADLLGDEITVNIDSDKILYVYASYEAGGYD